MIENKSLPLISVCTATHPPTVPYLHELYICLVRQTYPRWEWVIAPNGGAVVPRMIAADSRVKIVGVDGRQAKAKGAACAASQGEWIVRIDADDLILPTTCERVAFSPGQFTWSNWAVFEDKTWIPKWYDQRHGWQYRDMWFDGRKYFEHLAWPLGPLMVAGLYCAPSCMLAWRRSAYQQIGGFDSEPDDSPEHRPVCRTYMAFGAAGMPHIDECLYLYRQRPDSESLGVIPSDRAVAMHTAAYLEMVEPCYRRWIGDDTRLLEINLDEAWQKKAVGNNCVGLMHISKNDIPWDEVFRVMAPGGMVIVDHSIDAMDARFQRYHQSEAGTHYVCLKPPYSDRPLGAVAHP